MAATLVFLKALEKHQGCGNSHDHDYKLGTDQYYTPNLGPPQYTHFSFNFKYDWRVRCRHRVVVPRGAKFSVLS